MVALGSLPLSIDDGDLGFESLNSAEVSRREVRVPLRWSLRLRYCLTVVVSLGPSFACFLHCFSGTDVQSRAARIWWVTDFAAKKNIQGYQVIDRAAPRRPIQPLSKEFAVFFLEGETDGLFR